MSAFGVSGTNAHVIVEEPPAEAQAAPAEETVRPAGAVPWLLSGKTPQAVTEQARRLLTHLRNHPDHSPLDTAYSLATTRTTHDHRISITGTTREELLAKLTEFTETPPATTTPHTNGKVAFLFTGQGAQRINMGNELAAIYPEFDRHLNDICSHFDPHLEQPLRHTITTGDKLNDTQYTQPALFAIEVALYRLITSFGITPDYLAGHSIGEIAAAHCAGILTLTDATTLVTARAHLMQSMPPGGTMIAIQAPEHTIRPHLTGHETHIDIAAINTPNSTVISGTTHTAQNIATTLRNTGHKTHTLNTSHAFHSPHMDGMLNPIHHHHQKHHPPPPHHPPLSTLTAKTHHPPRTPKPPLLGRPVRHTVRFADAIRTLETEGVTTYVEIGRHRTQRTRPGITRCRGDHELPTAPRQVRAGHLATALGALHGRPYGSTGTVLRGHRGPPGGAADVRLPARAVLAGGVRRPRPTAAGLGLAAAGHPLLGARPATSRQRGDGVTGRLSAAHRPPGSAGRSVGDTTVLLIVRLAVRAASARLVLADSGLQLQVRLGAPDAEGRRALTVHGRSELPWTRHAARRGLPPPTPARRPAWPPAGARAPRGVRPVRGGRGGVRAPGAHRALEQRRRALRRAAAER
ncbi:Thioester reductase domain-containing protein OS=Streptomyces microflavus OX=1919 GN=HUT09_22165 PE=4 SV=1 [Streptomyces microflavus]